MKIDFLARQEHFVDHLLPVWKALPSKKRGVFYCHIAIGEYASKKGLSYFPLVPEYLGQLHVKVPGDNPIVTCAYGDFLDAYRSNPDRIFMLSEHGVGLAFGENAGYAGGLGRRNKVDCFMSSSRYVAEKNLATFNAPVYIVGVPKMDKYKESQFKNWMRTGSFSVQQMKESPVVCLSFHWNGSHISPEAGNAFALYGRPEVLELLKSKFNIIGHCHPKEREIIKPAFEKAGIPFVDSFDEVLEQADIYCNDCSSTMYEFCVTGKPVVVMNAPWFRKDVHHGLRFWDYSDVGKNVNNPKQLVQAIEEAIQDPNKYRKQREQAVQDLYPHLGNSARVFAKAIVEFTTKKKAMTKTLNYDKLVKLHSGPSNELYGISKYEVQHLCWLALEAKSSVSDVMLDIAENYGKSAICLASAVSENLLSAKVHAITTSKEHFDNGKIQASAIGLPDTIAWHWETAKQVFVNYSNAGMHKHNISLVFCSNVEDAELWVNFIAPGGYIAIHHCNELHTENRAFEQKIRFSSKFDNFNKVGRIFSARRKL